MLSNGKARTRIVRVTQPKTELGNDAADNCKSPKFFAEFDRKISSAEKSERLWPAPLDLELLSTLAPNPPRFIIHGWLPAGYASLIAGHGGVGKSQIALCAAVCVALGIRFYGLPVERRKVLYLSCEDREDVLHWRLNRICAHLGVHMAALDGWLHILDLVGKRTVLFEHDPRSGQSLTMPYFELGEIVLEYGARLIVADGIADTYGGNENARSEVKGFINSLLAYVDKQEGALLLVGHINKPSALTNVTSEGYSGSTGWHNSVRARWYLHAELADSEDGYSTRTGGLLLDLQKSNLGAADQQIRLAWDAEHSVFTGRAVTPATPSDKAHRAQLERDSILDALRACTAANVTVPAATMGRRTAFHVLSKRSEFAESLRSGKSAVRNFWSRIEDLRHAGDIVDAPYKTPDGHKRTCLAIPESCSGESANAE